MSPTHANPPKRRYYPHILLTYHGAMKRNSGFSLIELIIALAIAGILVAVGVARLNPNGAATRQAAEVVAAAVNRARYEAIRTNNTTGFRVVAGTAGTSGTVSICRDVDETLAFSCSTGVVAETIALSEGDLGRAVITSPVDVTLFFDRRGILRNPSSAGQAITITDRSGANSRTVTVLPTGRSEIN